MAVDWSKVKNVDDLLRLDDSILYDDSPEDGGIDIPPMNADLTEEEIEDAMFWARYSRGIMLVVGSAGAGKGLFANMLAWKMKHYFNKTVLLDYKPRKLFGVYHPFNEVVLTGQLGRMEKVATGDIQAQMVLATNGEKLDTKLQSLTREWVAKEGQVFLKNSVLVLDEFARYMDKRRPFKPIGLVLADIFRIWRHLDTLIIGVTIDKKELDRFRCIPKLVTEVRCTWLTPYTRHKYGLAEYSAKCVIYPLRYIGVAGEGVLEVSGKPIPIIVEGGKPQECLGGKRWVDIYNTKDAKIIQTPKSLMRQ